MTVKQKEIDLAKVVKLLILNKKIMFIFSAISVLIAILYCIFATPLYTARILINPPRLSDAGTSFSQAISGLNGILGGNSGILRTDADIAVALMRSQTNREIVIKKLDLIKKFATPNMSKTRDVLASKVSFVQDLKSGFVAVNVIDKDPKLAADIANYYIVSLGQVVNNMAYARDHQRYKFYNDQLSEALTNLHEAESALKDFNLKNGIIAGQQAEIIAGIATQLQAQLVSANVQLQSMSYYLSPDNPQYKALQATISSYKEQLNQANNQSLSDKISLPSNLAPELASKYVSLVRDLRFKELVYDVMRRQAKATQLDSLSEVSPMAVQVIDFADVPILKTSPKRLKIVMYSLVMGLVIGALFVILKNIKQVVVIRELEE